MNQKIIPCQVKDEHIIGAGVVVGAEGSGRDTILQLEFGPMWDGLVKYVTFRDALGENPVVVLLTTNMIERLTTPALPDHPERPEKPGAFPPPPPPPGWLPPPPPGKGHRSAVSGLPLTDDTCPEGHKCECLDCLAAEADKEEPPQPVERLVYNVPIPAKAKALQGQMMAVVQGYSLNADGSQVATATMTATAYFRVLSAQYAMPEDESVTPSLSQQLQAQIEGIKGDIVDAAKAADAKEAARKSAATAAKAAKLAQESAGEAAESAAGAAKAVQDVLDERMEEAKRLEQAEQKRVIAEQMRESAEQEREDKEGLRDEHEDAREQAEAERAAAEVQREAAEAERAEAEQARKDVFLPLAGGTLTGPLTVRSKTGTEYLHIDPTSEETDFSGADGAFRIGKKVEITSSVWVHDSMNPIGDCEAAGAYIGEQGGIRCGALQAREGITTPGGLEVGRGATIRGGIEIPLDEFGDVSDIEVSGGIKLGTSIRLKEHNGSATIGDRGSRFNTIYLQKVDASEKVQAPKIVASDKFQLYDEATKKYTRFRGARSASVIIGTSTAGHTLNDCDFLCDGVDDQVEINKAIQALPCFDDAETLHTGTVLFLPGRYEVSEAVTLSECRDVALEGASARITVTTDLAYENRAIFDTSGSCGGIAIRDFELVANTINNEAFAHCILNTFGSSRLVVSGCTMSGSGSGITYGILKCAGDCVVDHCIFRNLFTSIENYSDEIATGVSSPSVIITNSHFYDSDESMLIYTHGTWRSNYAAVIITNNVIFVTHSTTTDICPTADTVALIVANNVLLHTRETAPDLYSLYNVSAQVIDNNIIHKI